MRHVPARAQPRSSLRTSIRTRAPRRRRSSPAGQALRLTPRSTRISPSVIRNVPVGPGRDDDLGTNRRPGQLGEDHPPGGIVADCADDRGVCARGGGGRGGVEGGSARADANLRVVPGAGRDDVDEQLADRDEAHVRRGLAGRYAKGWLKTSRALSARASISKVSSVRQSLTSDLQLPVVLAAPEQLDLESVADAVRQLAHLPLDRLHATHSATGDEVCVAGAGEISVKSLKTGALCAQGHRFGQTVTSRGIRRTPTPSTTSSRLPKPELEVGVGEPLAVA